LPVEFLALEGACSCSASAEQGFIFLQTTDYLSNQFPIKLCPKSQLLYGNHEEKVAVAMMETTMLSENEHDSPSGGDARLVGKLRSRRGVHVEQDNTFDVSDILETEIEINSVEASCLLVGQLFITPRKADYFVFLS